MAALLKGSHPQTVDDRGRLAIPFKLLEPLRELAGAKEGEDVEVCVGISDRGCLAVFPKPLAEETLGNVEGSAKVRQDFFNLLASTCNYLDDQVLDKQNRFRVSSLYSEEMGLTGEVVVMGSGWYLEVVSKAQWREILAKSLSSRNDQSAKLKEYMYPEASAAGK